MKANELMIGDWVINPVHHDKTKIEGIYYDKELHCLVATDGRFPQEIFEPIPLTEEILKANGFWEEDGGFARFFPNVGKFTTWKSRIEDVQCTLLGTVELPLRYVHELQHSLRLIGLEELANNLKIE